MTSDSIDVDVDPEHSEICEICHAREAHGTFSVEDVEMWVCDYCAVNATVETRDGSDTITFHLECD